VWLVLGGMLIAANRIGLILIVYLSRDRVGEHHHMLQGENE
jgi:hypothetical protein